ncbi:hypothetical protein [Parendozoicomonas haliclonae]|uniref:Uncharacterized protein n=1 Tax=Parendozoicomonas haliclonae TaxID=1960125 RepID=A0A1X7ARW4_9GAMM|nr:hypothetical protein [Parendozoicomonas haliclonae]SMA50839.1 hypothetical protein EHSB41UT_04656 [Parendozoicomonas haliclonae]
MFLGIFTGIEVLFFLLGVMTTLALGSLIWLKLSHGIKPGQLALFGIGLLVIIAGIAWSVSSVLEGEPQAGSMGMMVIILPGLVLSAIGGRQIFSAMR